MTLTDAEKRTELIAQAERAHAGLPQYRGHWDGWVLGLVTHMIRTKLGVAFQKGDVVLVDPDLRREKVCARGCAFLPYAEWPEREFRLAYSFRNECNTQVPANKIKLI